MADVDQAAHRHSRRRLRVRPALVSLLAASRRRGAHRPARRLDQPALSAARRHRHRAAAPARVRASRRASSRRRACSSRCWAADRADAAHAADADYACVPEISANKYALNIRFIAQNGDERAPRPPSGTSTSSSRSVTSEAGPPASGRADPRLRPCRARAAASRRVWDPRTRAGRSARERCKMIDLGAWATEATAFRGRSKDERVRGRRAARTAAVSEPATCQACARHSLQAPAHHARCRARRAPGALQVGRAQSAERIHRQRYRAQTRRTVPAERRRAGMRRRRLHRPEHDEIDAQRLALRELGRVVARGADAVAAPACGPRARISCAAVRCTPSAPASRASATSPLTSTRAPCACAARSRARANARSSIARHALFAHLDQPQPASQRALEPWQDDSVAPMSPAHRDARTRAAARARAGPAPLAGSSGATVSASTRCHAKRLALAAVRLAAPARTRKKCSRTVACGSRSRA